MEELHHQTVVYGVTVQEARDLVEDAIRLHIEDRLERGESIQEEVGTKELSRGLLARMMKDADMTAEDIA